METYTILLLIIILLGILSILYITIYNHLQYNKTKIEKAEGNIDDDLRTKFDLIVKADNIIKNSIKSKNEYLKEIVNLKEEKISNFNLERKLKEAETIIDTLYDDNKELNENETMNEVKQELKAIDEKLVAGISYYNKHVSDINAYIRKFPNNIISKIHRIKVRPFFDGKDMTDTDIEDFKL